MGIFLFRMFKFWVFSLYRMGAQKAQQTTCCAVPELGRGTWKRCQNASYIRINIEQLRPREGNQERAIKNVSLLGKIGGEGWHVWRHHFGPDWNISQVFHGLARNCVQTLMMLTLMISWHFHLVSLWGWAKWVRQYLDGLLCYLVRKFTFYLSHFSSGSIIKSSFCLYSTVINNQIPSKLVSCDWKVKLMQKSLNPAWPSGGRHHWFQN